MVSIASLIVLIGAAAAIVHHVRAGSRNRFPQAPPEPDFSEHLYAAAQYGTPRSSRLVSHQNVKSITAKKDWPPSPHPATDHSSNEQDNSMNRRRTTPLVYRASESGGGTSFSQAQTAIPHLLRPVAGTRKALFKRF
jgi:hypothetical protein